ncbi:MAG: ankyrin repeat domain-containing protein [Candidatus Aminicenantes bacterium]
MKTSVILFSVLSLMFCGAGAAFGQQGIPEEARRHFDRGIAAVEMATTAADYESAIKEFKEAVRLAPDWPDAYYNLGLVQEKAGKLGEAVESYKSYLRVSPEADDAEAVKSLVNKLEYMAERENEINKVYGLMLMKTDQVRWVRISKNGDDQPDWEVEHNSYLVPVKNLPLFSMEDGSLFKNAYLVDSSIYRKRSVSRPMQGQTGPRRGAIVKVNGRFFEYRYGFTMRIDYKYEDTDGGELSIKAEIVSTDPPRIKREQQVKWPDGLTSVTEFVYELDDFVARVEAEASKPDPVDVKQRQEIESLIAAGGDVNAPDSSGKPPLFRAVESSQVQIIELLLANGANINAKDASGEPLIRKAAFRDDTKIIELLIDKGVDINAKDKTGWTALHSASANAAGLLLAKGADINAKNDSGWTPLFNACEYYQPELARILIALGADVGAPDKFGQTPLHAAAGRGHMDLAELLISKGAEVNAKDRRGETPLDKAKFALKVHKRDAYRKMIDLLKKHGAR